MNTLPVRIRKDTKVLLDRMRDMVREKDKYARTDYASLMDRAVRYWVYGDVDKGG